LGLDVRKGQRPPWIVPDELWARIEPLLPVVPRRADHPGRRRLDDRKVLCGILFVLYTGIPWEFLPQEPGFGSGMTCWRRLRDWHQAVIARRGTGHGSGLGVYRWVVEQSIALLHWFRRLRIRWEIRDDIHEAFLSLACAIICWRRLRNLSLVRSS
jgi:transposase